MDRPGLDLKPSPPARRLMSERARQLLPIPSRLLFRPPTPQPETPTRSGGSRALVSYLLLVALPTLAYLGYAVALATPGYVSETRITVQSALKKHALSAGSASMLSRLIGSVAAAADRDPYLVLNYVKSAAVIDDLGGRPALERYFAKPEIDFFSRLPREQPIEELRRYWRAHVGANVDTVSGLLTLTITAYSPQDALELAERVNALSEKLINDISLRVRKDALDKARLEVTRAGDELAARREALLAFRNSNELIDPTARAKSLAEAITKLTLEKVDLDTNLTVLSSNATDAPALGVLKAKIASLDQQIDKLKAQLTAPAGGAVSAQLAGYEALKLQEEFAQKIYLVAEDSYLRAEQELERQQLYLIVVVKPTRAEEATYPRTLPATFLTLACLTIVWAIVALILASLRDQID